MNKTILAFTLIATLNACKKPGENKIIEEETNNVPKLEMSVSALQVKPNNTDLEGDATYNLLGYGYDITDKYANKTSIRGRVIDVPLFVMNNDQEAYSPSNSTTGFTLTVNAVSAQDLSAKLSEKYDASMGLNVFKSTIVSSFPENDALSKKYAYGYFSQIFVRRKLRIEASKGINSLADTFTQDVAALNPEQLVKKYGTHILQRIHIGTRINVIYQSEVPDNADRQLAIKEGFYYALSTVFGFFPSNGGSFDVKALKANSSVKLRYEVIGGDPREIKEEDIAGVRRVIVNDWNRSASESNYRFIDFDKNGLFPLYDMIADKAKRAEVQSFILNYISVNEVK